MADEQNTPLPPPGGEQGKGKASAAAAGVGAPAGLVGRQVRYRHRDPITGDQLSGEGLVIWDDGGVLRVSPLSPLTIDVDPADVAAVGDEQA